MKTFTFYRKDLVGLLHNYKRAVSLHVRDLIAQGKDLRLVTLKESEQFTEDFIDEMLRDGELKIEHILDDIDEVLEKTMGKKIKDYIQEKREEN